MSNTTITYTLSSGDPTQVTSVVLQSPAGVSPAYGVLRQDTGAVVVAAGTALLSISSGVWAYTFTDPAPGLLYSLYVERVYGGLTSYLQKYKEGGGDSFDRYLTLDQAQAIAASQLNLPAWNAANTLQQFAALLQATLDVDKGLRYQGRKFHRHQVLEFPRVPYETTAPTWQFDYWMEGDYIPEQIWDWDPINKVAIVPVNVQIACVIQADAILDGTRAQKLEALSLGLKSQKTGAMSEDYSGAAPGVGPVGNVLCRRAMQILQAYELRSGRIL